MYHISTTTLMVTTTIMPMIELSLIVFFIMHHDIDGADFLMTGGVVDVILIQLSVFIRISQ